MNKENKVARWTAIEDELLREAYMDKTNVELSGIFGRSVDSLRKRAYGLGCLGKSRALLSEIGRSTGFKKGLKPHNAQRLWSVRETHDRGFAKYDVKVGEPDVWKQLSHIVWEVYRMGGWFSDERRIPEGFVVRHRDGDGLHCGIDNLELIGMGEHMGRNTGDHLSDANVAFYLSGTRKNKREDFEAFKADKALIELKRNELKLRRAIKNCEL
jgi:hypothetical protein